MPRMDETVAGICQALYESDEIPYEYDHFTESSAVPPPFVLYRRVAANNFSGDGMVYHKGQGVDLELYAATPDEMAELMEKVEALLDAEELYYEKTADTVYITTEDFYETLYEL